MKIFLVFIIFLSVTHAEFNGQPKFLTQNGNLILEAVQDKNITLRLTRDSVLLVNGTNLLDALREKRDKALLEEKREHVSIESLQQDARALRRQVNRISRILSRLKNSTRNNGQLRRWSGRFDRLARRINEIETELSKNNCLEQECKNGGTCLSGYKNFHCLCMSGWEGKTCEADVDECYLFTGTRQGCQNNAVCVNTPGSYRCVCPRGFAGTHCLLRNATCNTAQAKELCGHGTCIEANNPQGYSCLCDQGWTNNNGSTPCEIDVNECADMNVNNCHTECINLPGSYKCGPCPVGYSGNGRECIDIDECKQNNGGCSMNPLVKCINTEGSYHCGNCPVGWTGDGRKCEPVIDKTACGDQNVCHPRARCEYISETVVCTCPLGMFGHGFGEHGCNETKTAEDICANHVCQNNGTCVVMRNGGSRCYCQPGYSGPTCAIIGPCTNNPCQNGGTCQLWHSDDFRCICPIGFTGKTCEIVRDLCGSIIRQSAGELIYPPNDDPSYAANERCAWLIRTTPTKVLKVNFTAFDVEEYVDCNKDWLQIHDGATLAAQLIGRFCGRSLPLGGSFVSSHSQLFFWFRSDNATQATGFKMTWYSEEHTCGGSMPLDEYANGVIRSPGYPGETPKNRECEWDLIAPYGQRLLLRFYEVRLGGNENCTRDTLKIFDSGHLLKAICVTSVPEPLHTYSNHIRIHYHTDYFKTDSAFQLHYEVVPGAPHCGGVYTQPAGFISGYMNAPVCQYLIKQPKGLRIQLEFTKMDLLATTNCSLQNVQVFDGVDDDESPSLGTFCDSDSIREPIVSSGNTLLVRYFYALPSFGLQKEFAAKYERVCKETYFGEDAGVITTPNYPNGYLESLKCTYIIIGPINSRVRIEIEDFDMVESVAKMNDDDIGDDLNNPIWGNGTIDESTNYLDIFFDQNNKRRFYKSVSLISLQSPSNHLTIVFNGMKNGRKARGLSLKYSFAAVTCGGVFVTDTGEIKYTDILGHFCQWVIELPANRHISLNLTYLMPCDSEGTKIAIYSNSSNGDAAQLLGDYCGDSSIQELYSTNILTISLTLAQSMHSLMTYLAGSYQAVEHNKVCGGESSALYGVIKSPGWPKQYSSNMECIWIINAPIGHKIELEVKNFSLETTGDSRCTDDFMEIRNGKFDTSPLIGRYCGTRIPKRIPSFGNYLHIRFVSDTLIEDDGFLISWQQTETGCGGRLTAYKGSIHAPHIDQNTLVLNKLLSCDWEILVAKGSSITLTLTMTKCLSESLKIYDGLRLAQNALMHYNCSSLTDTITLESTGNTMLISYMMLVVEPTTSVFMIDYVTNCKRQLHDISGVIESPNYPEDYPTDIECNWDIRAGRNNKITFVLAQLDIEVSGSESCSYDYVELVDMQDEEVLTRTRYCSTTPPPQFTTVGNRLQLLFVSDYSTVAKGFHAEYERSGCGKHFTNEYGMFNSPKMPYSVDLDCEWYIEVSAGNVIELRLELVIETDTPDCSKDVFVVADKKNFTKPLLHECHIDENSISVRSNGNHMYIHFLTSDKRARKYFKATYFARQAKCGGVLSNSLSGVIATPNYPEAVTNNMECNWVVSVGAGYGFSLNYFKFDIPCGDASFEMSSVGSEGEVAIANATCSDNPPKIAMITDPELRINYISKGNNGGAFAIEYEKLCGGVQRNPSGYLTSRASEDCMWLFQQLDAELTLHIAHLECSCSNQKNCTNGLMIYNSDAILLHSICNDHQASLGIRANNLVIVSKSVNFRGSYTTIQNSCGGTLTSLTGILASPRYPEMYPENVECLWELNAKRGNYFEITFEDMNITKSPYCNDDYLEIRLKNKWGPLMGLYCDSTVPTESLVLLENVWIKFHSAEGNTNGGFRLRWNYAHLNELNATSGIIEAPPLMAIAGQDTPYQWRLNVPRGQHIELKFVEYNRGLNLFDGYDDTALPVDIQYSPWLFTSSSNVLYLSTNNAELEMFKLEWRTISHETVMQHASISKCNQTIILPHKGDATITSPNYPESYANHLKCEWLIKAESEAHHVVFKLNEVKMEQSYACTADSLTVYTSANLIDWQEQLRTCQITNDTAANIIHGTPYVKLLFKTDQSIVDAGFNSSVSTHCGSNMTASTGSIIGAQLLVDGMPQGVITCLWHITVQPGKRIAITFKYPEAAATSTAEQCETYAVLYDGFSENAAVIPPGRICNRTLTTFTTTTNQVVVKYRINRPATQTTWNAWDLDYREFGECGGEVRLTHESPSVNISSPRYPNVPQPHSDCTWIIIAPAGETLLANFIDRFDMNMAYCNREYLELFDGGTQLAPLLGHYCRRPSSVRTTGNLLYMHYRTNIPEPRTGFHVNISLGVCGGTYLSIGGAITSPNYRALSTYPRPLSCDYLVKLSPRFNLRLNFTQISMPFDSQHPELSDQIEILIPDANNTRLAMLYGNVTEMPVLDIFSNTFLLRFRSFINKNTSFEGFSLRYRSFSGYCYREATGDSGVLSLKVRQNLLYVPTLCRWKITVPKGQRVRLDFMNLHEHAQLNNTLTVSVFNDLNGASKIAQFSVADSSVASSYQSTDNFMFVRIELGKTPKSLSLDARYSSDEPSPCPEPIGERQHDLISITSLQPYDAFYCRIPFVLSATETITFNIEQLVLSSFPMVLFSGPVQFKLPDRSPKFYQFTTNTTNQLVSLASRSGSLELLQSNVMRLFQFRASYRRHPCGGELQLRNGLILSYPDIKQPVMDTLECVWTLKANRFDGDYTLAGNFSFTDSCEHEYLTISTPVVYALREQQRLCRGSGAFNGSLLQQPFTQILYHAVNFRPERSTFQFVASKALTCGTLTEVKDYTTLTVDSSTYKNNVDCSWEFTSTLGKYLSLKFSGAFFIENSANCSKDYLEVFDKRAGLWHSLARYCGRNTPETLNLTSNHIQIVFHTDNATVGVGFNLRINTHCNGVFNATAEKQTITLPSQFIGKIHCEYIIYPTDPAHAISVNYEKLGQYGVGVNGTCINANLKAYKQSGLGEESLIGEYCDNAVFRANNKLRITYDARLQRSFLLHYRLNTCGGNITAPSTIQALLEVDSDQYLPNMNCVWHVAAPTDQSIIIRFKYFDMERHSKCAFDYFAVYAGAIVSEEHQLHKLCGNLTEEPPVILVDNSQAVLSVVTDRVTAGRGFEASIEFTRNCNEHITLSDGNANVSFSRHYTVNGTEKIFCKYSVMAPPHHRVIVEFKDLQLNNGSCGESAAAGGCNNCNHLEVRDSSKARGAKMGVYCMRGRSTAQVISSYEDIQVTLNARKAGVLTFELLFRMEKSFCGGINEFLLDENTTTSIEIGGGSVNSLYQPNLHCTWIITSSNPFFIVFERFALQNRSTINDQCLDYVQIETSFRSNFYCGYTPAGFRVRVPAGLSGIAQITFHSDATIEDSGFKLNIVQTQLCNETFSELSNLIYHMGRHLNNELCTDYIRVPSNYSLSLYLPNLNFFGDCSQSFLNITDLNSNRTLSSHCRDNYDMISLLLPTNAVRIDSQYLSAFRVFYVAQLKGLPAGCGGSIYAAEGIFSSPPYNDRNASECRWEITIPPPNRIQLLFQKFNMGTSTNCPLDYVKILELNNDGSEHLLKTLCGQELPMDSIITNSNRIVLLSKKSQNFDGTGWEITFNAKSEVELTTNFIDSWVRRSRARRATVDDNKTESEN